VKTKKSNPPIVLASGSPRRRELMSHAGFRFTVQLPNVDESVRKGESPQKMVVRLSREKALAVKVKRGLILAADTTVVSPSGRNLGKPRNKAEAVRMLSLLQGKTHQVFTGYTWVNKQNGLVVQSKTRMVRTQVKMRKLSRTEIQAYVSTGEPMDKAGAYAAQGRGLCLIEWVRGSFSNVVGLPMTEVLETWKKIL